MKDSWKERSGAGWLDPIIRNKFADQPAVLADWKRSRHIERAPRAQTNGDGNGNDGGNNTQPPTP